MDEYIYKVLFLGDSSIGAKTSLIRRIVYNEFREDEKSTIGVDFFTKTIQTKFGEISLKLWDTVGQKSFKPIIASYIRGSHCIILGYDVTNRKSYESIRNDWYNLVMKNITGNNPIIYLVGNKIDEINKREISDEKGKSLANDLNIKYFGVSAKTGEGVDILLDDILNSLIKRFNNPMYGKKIQKSFNECLNF